MTLENYFFDELRRFCECLELVEKEARALQEALLARDSERILAAVTRQRVALDRVQEYMARREPLNRLTPQEKKHVIQPMVNRIRRVLTLNEKMSKVLLGVIDKTLSGLALGTRNTARVYDGYGRVARVAAPILVNAQG